MTAHFAEYCTETGIFWPNDTHIVSYKQSNAVFFQSVVDSISFWGQTSEW